MNEFAGGMIALLSPGFAARMAAEKAGKKFRFDHMLKSGKITKWDEDRTPLEKHQIIDAATWQPTLLFDTPLCKDPPNSRLKAENMTCCPQSAFFYMNRVLPKGEWLETWQGKKRGQVAFTDDVVTPVLCEKRQCASPRVWMGFTPCEIYSQRAGVRLATGRVVVGGLGLGWFLNKVASKKSVTEVIVVDREKALLDWLGPVLRAKYPALAKVSDWVHSDVYGFMENDAKNHAHTKYLLDIWPSFGCTDGTFDKWKKRLPKRNLWGWGDVIY